MSWKSSLIICGFLFALSSWSTAIESHNHKQNAHDEAKQNFSLLLLSVSLGVGTLD